MAITIAGTQGTVSEADWAGIMSFATQKYVRDALPAPTLLPSATAPTSLRLPAFKSLGAGVLVQDTETTTVALPAGVVPGRWYLLVLRRTWGLTPTAQHMWIATTSTTANPPATFPAGRQVTPGVVDDEPVLWYQHPSGPGTGAVYSLSALAGGIVESPTALWDAREQGFSHAQIQMHYPADMQWYEGKSEFYSWNVATLKWEPRGSDTITIYREWTGLAGNGVVHNLEVGIAGIFALPPMVLPVGVSTTPQNESVTAGTNATVARISYRNASATASAACRVLLIGIPKR